MDNIVSINGSKENTIEFDISAQGLSTDDQRVWFCISTGKMDLRFECTKSDESKWECIIPPLPWVEKTAFPCSIHLVADGYFFEPMSGTVNITGSAEVYAKVQHEKLAPGRDSDKKPVKKPTVEVKPAAKVRQSEKPIAQIAQEMLAAKGSDSAFVQSAKESIQSDDHVSKVTAILDNLNIKTTKANETTSRNTRKLSSYVSKL